MRAEVNIQPALTSSSQLSSPVLFLLFSFVRIYFIRARLLPLFYLLLILVSTFSTFHSKLVDMFFNTASLSVFFLAASSLVSGSPIRRRSYGIPAREYRVSHVLQ